MRIGVAAGAMGLGGRAAESMLETRWPGGALLMQVVRLSITIGVSLVVLGAASWLLRIREFQRGSRARHTPAQTTIAMKFRLLGLHPTVVVLAATHFIVDGFGNILAPLLPLLILNLNLSLAAAGTLQMCFQLANSVAQLGFRSHRRSDGDRVCSCWRDRSYASRQSR